MNINDNPEFAKQVIMSTLKAHGIPTDEIASLMDSLHTKLFFIEPEIEITYHKQTGKHYGTEKIPRNPDAYWHHELDRVKALVLSDNPPGLSGGHKWEGPIVVKIDGLAYVLIGVK